MSEVVRLFPVQGRTRLERENTRRLAKRAQGALFEVTPDGEPVPVCPVCSGEHFEEACTFGSAPTLDVDEHAPPCSDRLGTVVDRRSRGPRGDVVSGARWAFSSRPRYDVDLERQMRAAGAAIEVTIACDEKRHAVCSGTVKRSAYGPEHEPHRCACGCHR